MPKILELDNHGPSATQLLNEFKENRNRLKAVRGGNNLLAVGDTRFSFETLALEPGFIYYTFTNSNLAVHDGFILTYDPDEPVVTMLNQLFGLDIATTEGVLVQYPIYGGAIRGDEIEKYKEALARERETSYKLLHKVIYQFENKPKLVNGNIY